MDAVVRVGPDADGGTEVLREIVPRTAADGAETANGFWHLEPVS